MQRVCILGVLVCLISGLWFLPYVQAEDQQPQGPVILDQVPFEFSINADGSMQVVWEDKTYLLTKNANGLLAPVAEEQTEFPYDLLPELQAVYFFHLASLEKDWFKQKTYLSKALQYSPQNPTIRVAAQIFSLNVAENVLAEYRRLLTKNGVFVPLDMEGLTEKRKISFIDTFKESLGNTTYVLAILFTDYLDNLLAVWKYQQKEISDLERTIKIAKQLMQKHGLLLEQLFERRFEFPELSEEVVTLHNFSESKFYQSVIKDGMYVLPAADQVSDEGPVYELSDTGSDSNWQPLPLVQDLGIYIGIDFVKIELKTVLIGQANILNAWMILRGPAAVRAFGGTWLGRGMVRTLQLEKVITQAGRLPGVLQSAALWLALETADGCVVRWVYTGVTVYKKLAGSKAD